MAPGTTRVRVQQGRARGVRLTPGLKGASMLSVETYRDQQLATLSSLSPQSSEGPVVLTRSLDSRCEGPTGEGELEHGGARRLPRDHS